MWLETGSRGPPSEERVAVSNGACRAILAGALLRASWAERTLDASPLTLGILIDPVSVEASFGAGGNRRTIGATRALRREATRAVAGDPTAAPRGGAFCVAVAKLKRAREGCGTRTVSSAEGAAARRVAANAPTRLSACDCVPVRPGRSVGNPRSSDVSTVRNEATPAAKAKAKAAKNGTMHSLDAGHLGSLESYLFMQL